MSVDAPTCLHTGPAPFYFHRARTPPPACRVGAHGHARARALRSPHDGSAPSQWRARAPTRLRRVLSPCGAHPQPTCGRLDRTSAPGARTRMRAPPPPLRISNPACRAHAPSALPGFADRAPSHARSDGGWSARGARGCGKLLGASLRARLVMAMAARLFSQCLVEPGCHPGAAARRARALVAC